MELKQSSIFKQVYKKLHKNQLAVVNENIKNIMADPDIGELKIGDLASVRVHKFKYQAHLYLLAYEYTDTIDLLYLMAIGEHENFYEKLKKHLKSS
jgi:mRNA-degrading endonuclease RelE of RelBE toxin-antitoxin system